MAAKTKPPKVADRASSREVHFAVRLFARRPVNPEWLESQAIQLEEALIAQGRGLALGPSVAANFEHNGFELDVTVEAAAVSEAYDKLSHLLAILEREGGFELAIEDSGEIEATASAPVAVLAS